jgi:hypothetical protein
MREPIGVLRVCVWSAWGACVFVLARWRRCECAHGVLRSRDAKPGCVARLLRGTHARLAEGGVPGWRQATAWCAAGQPQKRAHQAGREFLFVFYIPGQVQMGRGDRLSCGCSMRGGVWCCCVRIFCGAVCRHTRQILPPAPGDLASFLLPCTWTLQLRAECHHFLSHRRRLCLTSDSDSERCACV